MPTYQDVTKRVRALIDDRPNHYADDNFLLDYVNAAQGQLVSLLVANSVREAVLRTTMLVPAGTSRIERWPAVRTLPNELPYSDLFAITAPPGGWHEETGAAAASSGLADPDGGTLAKRWSLTGGPAFDLWTFGTEVAPALSYFGSASVWLRTPDATYPYALRVLAGMADDNGPIAETMAYVDTVLTNEWSRVFVPFSGKTITAAPTGALRRCVQIQLTAGSTALIELYRAVVRPGYADTPDTQTAGFGTTVGRIPVLPAGILVPDRLLERQPGAASNAWTVLRGPTVIRDFPGTDRLLQWDWRAGGIDLGPARADRELMIEYWGELADNQLGTNVLEEELLISGSLEALACITAGLTAQARGQHDAAGRFGVMQADGSFSGAAGGLTLNLVNTMNKAQQSEPTRRQPYFGVARYPGVSGNMIGGWPYQSN